MTGAPGLDQLVTDHHAGSPLTRPFYTDPAIFNLERERILENVWLYAGHVSRIPRAGDFFLYELGDESIIVSRDNDDAVHAMFNVCRHRGSRVCLESQGHARRLICPYHQWVYDKDGSLLAAQHMPDGFDPSVHGLRRCHLRVLEGLIFLNLSENPVSFDPIAQQLGEYLSPYQLSRTKPVHIEHRLVRSNWKLIMENFVECYHCPKGHPEWCAVHDVVPSEYGPRTNPSRIAEAHARAGAKGWPSQERSYVGPDDAFIIWRTSVRDGAVTESDDGKLVAPLLGTNTDPNVGIVGFQAMPSLWAHVCVDHAVVIRFTPLTALTTDVEATWLVRNDAIEGRDYDPVRVSHIWRVTGEQDYVLCENNQLGVNSKHYVPGPYATIEAGPQRFLHWYFDRLQIRDHA